jgi:hypothetical protein
MGTGSQSTLAISPTTGTLFQDQETAGIYALTTGGTQTLIVTGIASSVSSIAVDDVSGDLVLMGTPPLGLKSNTFPAIVFPESGGVFGLCYLTPGASSFSSVSAKGGYIVLTDPNDNLVGIASLAGCSGIATIPYTTISIPGQPWAVSMTNGAELDAYVLSRDKASANGLPMLSKVNVLTGVTDGTVELTGFTPVSTVRAADPDSGLYQVQVFTQTATAAVLSTSDNSVLIINTDTSNGKAMKIMYSVSVSEVPFAIAAQDSATNPTLWVAYILANSSEAVTHIGAINPATGSYSSNVGECQTGILAGGFIATSNGVYCAQGSTIAPPLVLQP